MFCFFKNFVKSLSGFVENLLEKKVLLLGFGNCYCVVVVKVGVVIWGSGGEEVMMFVRIGWR